ncbi:MAG: TRAP transporter small permease [Oscillospiraceae bacterium]|nr:TRAP transporter small permease [Oscillospiraceae bacterium]
MKTIKTILIGIFNISYRILCEYSKYVLLVIVGIVCADVFKRNILSGSIMWAQEIALLLIVWMCFLSMAIGAENDLHISVHMFYNRMPKTVQKVLYYFNKFVTMSVGIFVGVYGIKLVRATWRQFLPASKLPAGMLYLMMPVGGFLMAYFMLLDLFNWKKDKITVFSDAEAEDEDEANLAEKEELLQKQIEEKRMHKKLKEKETDNGK